MHLRTTFTRPSPLISLTQKLLATIVAGLLLWSTTATLLIQPAYAADITNTPMGAPKVDFVLKAPEVEAKSYILMDARSGQIIARKNDDQRMEPASLTKMMTLYIVENMLDSNKLDLDDKVLISTRAWKTEGSRMFLNPGSRVPIKLLVKGIIVSSGNDATVAMAEHIAGSEDAFASLMNQYAAALGMKDSHFMNPDGLPVENHYSTAHDLATLARHLIFDFPDYYHWYSEKTLTYNKITQNNRNRLLWHNPEVDGLKTGHTESAGYCLVASAQLDGSRFIAVVLGTESDKAREQAASALLNYALQYYQTIQAIPAYRSLGTIRTLGGQQSRTSVGVQKPIYVTVPLHREHDLKITPHLPAAISAPVQSGQPLAHIEIELDGKVLKKSPLVALHKNPAGSRLSFYFDKFIFWIINLWNQL